MLRRSFLLALIAAPACATVFQLKQGCKISGYVFNSKSPEHVGLPYHIVRLARIGAEERHVVAANLRGWFEFPPVKAGYYLIQADGSPTPITLAIASDRTEYISINLFVNPPEAKQ